MIVIDELPGPCGDQASAVGEIGQHEVTLKERKMPSC